LELSGAVGKLVCCGGAELEVVSRPAGPFALQLRVVEVDPDDPAAVDPVGEDLGEHALTAADVEDRPRARRLQQLEQVPLEAGHHPPDDRIGGSVLVVGVAGRNRLAVPPALAGASRLGGGCHRGPWRARGTAALSALFSIASPTVSSTSVSAVGSSAASSDGSAGSAPLPRA